jgi:hypothetical protein
MGILFQVVEGAAGEGQGVFVARRFVDGAGGIDPERRSIGVFLALVTRL